MKNTLEFLLTSKKISPPKLASEIGVSRQTIYNILKEKTPSLEVAMAIADHFGKDVKDIFSIQNVKHVVRKKTA